VSDGAALVILPNWVGDCAMAAPALRALRAARPDARWILAGAERSAPLYGRWPCDALIPIAGRGAPAILGLARRLRGLGIREALLLGPSFRSALMPALAGIPRRVGWGTDGRRILLTETAPAPGRDVPLARSYLRLAARLGADPDAPLDPGLPIGADERDAAADRLRAMGVDGSRVIAFLPGATYGETKRWPVAHWAALGRMLHGAGWNLLVLGGAEECEIADRLSLEIGEGAYSLAGRLPLRASLSVLSIVTAAVSNDSGGMHLAAAAGAAVVGIFGSTNPAWTGPLGARSRAVTLGLACAPCYARTCPTQIECLRDLAPARVASEVEALLVAPAGAPR